MPDGSKIPGKRSQTVAGERLKSFVERSCWLPQIAIDPPEGHRL